MPNGPIQEAGETARSAIDVFRSSPITLALILMNLGLLGYLYYAGVQAHRERATETKLLYENRAYVAKILSSCVSVEQMQRLLRGLREDGQDGKR